MILLYVIKDMRSNTLTTKVRACPCTVNHVVLGIPLEFPGVLAVGVLSYDLLVLSKSTGRAELETL